jgi:dCMP deaminase
MLVTTLAPCLPCSQLIISAGIERVMYLEEYRDPSGLQLLDKAGVMLWRG